MSLPKFEELEAGFEMPSLTKAPIEQVQLVRYAGASGDFNPIHTVPEKAKQAGLDGTIAHGMLIMGMLGQAISSWAGIKNVKAFNVTFKAMTKPGDTVTAKGTFKKKYEKEGEKLADFKVWIEDQNGEVKVDGKTTIRFE